jgi:glycosyltransferase involved in cell wall biosynthesis
MASGLPIISSNVGGISEYVNKNNGILVKSEDEKALFNAISYMLDNYNKFNRKGIAETAEKNFSYSSVSKKFYSIYKSILDMKV